MDDDKNTFIFLLVILIIYLVVVPIFSNDKQPLTIRDKAEILRSFDYNDLNYNEIEGFAEAWDDCVENFLSDEVYEERSYYDY